MIDSERPHRTTSINNSSSSNSTTTATTNEFFICFSSMKIPSKSILSPGRSREPSQISLSSSLSRRLRSSGSLKGGQASPAMFPTNTTTKKRGCGFENPEPSSPKVTCIGQVRVKTKKQGKKIRARSKRRTGDVSFRKSEQSKSRNSNMEPNLSKDLNLGHFDRSGSRSNINHREGLQQRNQRWVHLPVTICEALRSFGSELNCFLPCRSSCMDGNQKDGNGCGKEDETHGGNGSSCGVVFARWLLAVQEGGELERREIEEVVEEEEEEKARSRRRHIFEDIEIDFENNIKCEDIKNEEDEGRVSTCIPPKNALLLMRCRSDPVKMAALANRFWESSMPEEEKEEEEEEESKENGEELRGEKESEVEGEEQIEDCNGRISTEGNKKEETLIIRAEKTSLDSKIYENEVEVEVDVEDEDEERNPNVSEVLIVSTESNGEDEETENQVKDTEPVVELGIEDTENGDNCVEENEIGIENNAIDDQTESEIQTLRHEPEEDLTEAEDLPETAKKNEGGEEEEEEEEKGEANERSDPGGTVSGPEPVTESDTQPETITNPVLPDCLLLMMCEPKLSMEVSKETWVCSTDFIKWLPERPPVKNRISGEVFAAKKVISPEAKILTHLPTINQPPAALAAVASKVVLQSSRSSCSYPAVPPSVVACHGGSGVAKVIDQKLISSKAYEPFVLKRCKSEPVKSAAKLAPDACFWKNRKLQPHVGAAGVGF